MWKQVILIMATTLCFYGCVACGAHGSREAQDSIINPQKEQEYESKTKNRVSVEDINGVEVFAIDGNEIDGSSVRAYLDGLSEDVYCFDDDIEDQESILKDYEDTYRNSVESLGYKAMDTETMGESSKLLRFCYSGVVDGDERMGQYLFYAAESGNGMVVYVINIPLSGMGKEGEAALKELLESLDCTYGI